MKISTVIVISVFIGLLASCQQAAAPEERFIGVEIAGVESGSVTDVDLVGGRIPFSVYSSLSVNLTYPWEIYFTTDGSVPTTSSNRYDDWDNVIPTSASPLWISDYEPHRVRALFVFKDLTATADVTLSASVIRPSYLSGDLHTPMTTGKGVLVDGAFTATSVTRTYRADLGSSGTLKVEKSCSNLASLTITVYDASGDPVSTNVADGATVAVQAGYYVSIITQPGSLYYVSGGDNGYSASLFYN